MLTPKFETSLDGLRSAVRLRHALWGTPNPEQAARRYMHGYGISDPLAHQAEVLRGRIDVVVRDIEHLSVCVDSECPLVAHGYEPGLRSLSLVPSS